MPASYTSFSNNYWIINNYGANATFTPLTSVKFNNLPPVASATATAADFNLFKRNSGQWSNTWGSVQDVGDVYNNNAINSDITFSTNNGINGFSQFLVTSPLVAPTAGSNSPVCTGNTLSLTANSITGATYLWNGPNSFSSSSQNLIFTGVTTTATGTYSVTVTVNGSTSPAGTIAVTVNPLPVISTNGNITICTGGSTILTASGGTSYVWEPEWQTTVSIAIGPTVSTTYTVTGTDANSCSNIVAITVNVNSLPTVTANASATAVCAGTMVTLTGGGASSYVWTGGVTDGVGFVPASTDTYTVTGTDANNCTNTATITVTVNPNLPVSVTIAGTTTICAGTNATFTATPTNGGSSPTYQWQVNGVNVGTNSVTYSSTTLSNTDAVACILTSDATCAVGNPAASNALVMTVNSLPTVTANASPSAVCTGTTVMLTGGGASSYIWTGGVTDGIGFVPASTDTYTVTGTDANNCTNTATITVTVNPNLPVSVTIAGTTTICAETNATFTATPTNGGSSPTYQWQVNGVNVGTNSVTYSSTTLSNTDAVACILTSDATCAAGNPDTSNTLTMTVNPLPTVILSPFNPDTVCIIVGTFALTGGAPAGGTYSGNGVSGGMFNPSVTGTGAHTVTYTYIDGNVCADSASQIIYVDVCTGGMAQNNNSGIVIFPNPNIGQFQIQSVARKDLCIDIYNTLGEKVFQQPLNTQHTTFHLNLPAGIYHYRVNDANETMETGKMVIE